MRLSPTERVSTDGVEAAEPVSGVELSVLARTERMNVQRFAIDPGATVPAHSHEQEQLGYVVSGELTFLVGEEDPEEVAVGAGDSFALDAHETHGVRTAAT